MPGLNRSRGRLLPILVGLLASCAGPAGPPAVARNAGHATAPADAGDAMARDCQGLVEPANRSEDPAARRNRLVSATMFAIDVRYNEYERRLLGVDRRIRRGALDAVSILSATPRTGGDLRNRILNLVLTQIQTQMRENRAELRAPILRSLELSYEAWTSCQALMDILAYERVGSVDLAINVLTQRANAPGR